MKFYSKFTNYRVVLISGTQAIPVAGKAKVDTVSVKFIDNRLNVDDSKEEVLNLLVNHHSYGKDFWMEDEDIEKQNPYATRQKQAEPHHVITEMDKGTLGRSVGTKPPVTLNQEQMAFAKEMAREMAKEMVGELIKKEANKIETLADPALPETKVVEDVMTASPSKSSKQTGKK